MRRQIGFLAAAIAAAGLVACGPKNAQSGKETASVESIDETGSVEETGSGGETGSGEEAGSGEETGSGEEAGSGGETGSAEETGSGETAAESGSAMASDQKLTEIHEAVKKAYGDRYVPNMPYDETMLEEQFGLRRDWYDAVVAEGPMISAHVETYIAVKAKAENVEDVEKALSSYRKNQIEAGLQYPMNMPKLQASQVLTHGNYVFFVMLGSPDMEAEEQGEEAALESAQQNNQIGIDVIDGFF